MPSVVMPQPGQSVTEGTVLKWMKQVGDTVAADEILVEIETEKVNVEVPSPFAGTLTQILVPEGETVPVGSDLATIEPVGAPAAVGASQSGVQQMEAAEAGVQMTDGEQPPPNAVAAAGLVPSDTTPVAPAPPVVGPRRNGAGSGAGAGSARYSPAVLTLAAEHNLDLAQITGSGMGGRVTRKDVIQFLEQGAQAVQSAAPSAQPVAVAPQARAPEAPPAPRPAETTASTPPVAAPTMPASEPVAGEDEEIFKPSATRLTIARNMVRSALSVPVAWMVVEVDVTGLVRLRERHRESFRQRESVDLTYLPFLIQALVGALKAHPMLNSEWRDEQIVLKKRLNIGIAVGVDEGLIVPVIQNADRLSVSGLAHAINDLATRARSRKLRIEDVTGGTFTLDNTGVFGSLVSQPIINPPQAAILSTEAIIKRPVVRDDAIAIRSMMNLCISFDHRIVDGSHVGPFMQELKRALEALGPETPVA